MKLRVLMLSTDLQRGGLPMRLVRLAVRLREVGVEPVVGCLAGRGPLSEELTVAGVETFACGADGPRDLRCLARLAEHVRRVDPDVIHASLCHANVAARLVGRLDRWRPIITSTVTIEIERHWHRLLECLTYGWSDLHVANSAAVARHLCNDLGFPPERIVVVPNAVALDEIDQAPAIDRSAQGLALDVPLVLWAGRMDPVKNLSTFVEVVERIHRRSPVQAVLLGDGPERERVQRTIRERRVGSVIRVARWTNQTANWLKAADCLLLPSFTEGSPNVVIEAMAAGCPVVASDIPACRELIEDGVHGWLCGSCAVDELAAAVEAVCEDRQSRETLVRAARSRVQERHSMGEVLSRWRRVYEKASSF